MKTHLIIIYLFCFNILLSDDKPNGLDKNLKIITDEYTGNSDQNIFKVVTEGDIKSLKKLLQKGIDPNVSNKNGFTPLFTAALRGDTQSLITLLQAGANPNIKAKNGTTPLYWGKISCNRDILISLVKYGALSDKKLSLFRSSLLDDVIELKKNINSNNINDNYLGWYLLHWAAAGNSVKVILFLIEKGFNLDIKSNDQFKETPLHIEVQFSNKYAVEILCRKGANVNSLAFLKMTPLHFAVFERNIPIIKLLLHNGANLNNKDINGNTPLFYAKKLKNKQIIEILTEWKK